MYGDLYTAHMYRQKGYGKRYYKVSNCMQGTGLGSIARKVYDFLQPFLPVMKKTSKAIGKQLINSGANILQEKIDNKENKTLKEIIKEEREKAVADLSNKALQKLKSMSGGSKIRKKNSRRRKISTTRSTKKKKKTSCKKSKFSKNKDLLFV